MRFRVLDPRCIRILRPVTRAWPEGTQRLRALVLWDGGRKEEVRVRVAGLEEKNVTAIWREKFPRDQRPASSASLGYAAGDAVAILKINRFGGTAGPERKPLAKFIDEAFTEMEAKKSTALVLDLRDNGGGADELGKRLLSHLVDQPFRYYDDLVLNALDFSFRKYASPRGPLPAKQFERLPDGKFRMTSHPNWGERSPGKPVFHGKVYALINGGSFSTTCRVPLALALAEASDVYRRGVGRRVLREHVRAVAERNIAKLEAGSPGSLDDLLPCRAGRAQPSAWSRARPRRGLFDCRTACRKGQGTGDGPGACPFEVAQRTGIGLSPPDTLGEGLLTSPRRGP